MKSGEQSFTLVEPSTYWVALFIGFGVKEQSNHGLFNHQNLQMTSKFQNCVPIQIKVLILKNDSHRIISYNYNFTE